MTSAMPGDETGRPDWVCQRGVAWALDDAPCPADLLGTLIAIARRCWTDGTGSYQSKPTLAKKTGKSKDQVDADVKKLLELGLIRFGDQTLPERNKVPAGQRPVVYDVALEKRGPKPARTARNKTGKNKADPQTPGMDTGGGMDTRGGTDTPDTGGMDTSLTPGMDTPQRTLGKNPSKNTPLSPASPSLPAPRDPGEDDRERDGSTSSSTSNLTPQQQMVIEADCPEHLAQHVVEYLEAKHGVRGLGWWNTVRDRGHIRGHVQDGIAANTSHGGDVDAEDDTLCPLHSRFPLTDCGVCWADVKGGDDPYKGREGERPTGWWAIYNQQGRRDNANADNAAGWAALGQHEAYRNPPDSAYGAWEVGQRTILDHEPEASR